MINSLKSQRSSRNPGPSSPLGSTTCCSFEMIRASFATRVGKRGVFALYMDGRGPRSQRVSARTTDQREIRCERQAVATAHQPSRSACRWEFGPGSAEARDPSCADSDLAQHHWQRQDRTSGPSTVSKQLSRAASISSCGCATSSRTAARPSNPYIGTTPGRNDSRCAGIRK